MVITLLQAINAVLMKSKETIIALCNIGNQVCAKSRTKNFLNSNLVVLAKLNQNLQ